MKWLLNPLALILVLTACTPAEPVVPTITVMPATAIASTAPTNTLTPKPTATSKPTYFPSPNGWNAIAEAREIGGRQVVINENGVAATEIDGVFYPVDAKGCFYTEFYNPEQQKKNPRIMELMKKINSEPSFVFNLENSVGILWPRHTGRSVLGYSSPKVTRPAYTEMEIDVIIADQRLCFNERSGEWEHMLDVVLARDESSTPNDTYVVRVVDGWLRKKEYTSFTYLQETMKDERGFFRIGYLGSKKAATITDAFNMYSDLIECREQVGLRIPDNLWVEKGMELSSAIRLLSEALPNVDHAYWSDNIKDPDFLVWVTRPNNQVAYFGDNQHMDEIYVKNGTMVWRFMGEQIVTGAMPELVVRMVQVAKK